MAVRNVEAELAKLTPLAAAPRRKPNARKQVPESKAYPSHLP